MCGVCGIYNYRGGEPVERRLVEAMTTAMVHRGPDDDGFLLHDELGLGMRRLSIIDLAGGAQPISNEAGDMWVVQNGEIYNFADLRDELEAHGHVFRTRSDSEVIIHAYEEWGLDGLSRLNGMFGLAIWDARERRLVVARDPFGVKPVYYWDDGERLAFASEVRSLLCHPRVPRAVDEAALGEFLELTYLPAPRTMFSGIEKLLPGHALVCTPDGRSIHRFYAPRPTSRRADSHAELVAELRDRIELAIERQTVADVPVGVMLSGGVDSATVATVMTKRVGAPIDTFTVGFAGDYEKNEFGPARETAQRIGSRHHEVRVSAEEFADFLPMSVWHMEEPVATAQTLPYFRVCELARSLVKVVLTGQGADEPFAGYPRHLGERYGWLYRAVPRSVREYALAPAIRRLPRNEQLKRAAASLGTADPLARMLRVYSVVDPKLGARLQQDGRGVVEREWPQVWQADIAELDDLNKMLYVDARTSLPDNLLLYGDKMAMAVSLEARVPFLDLELMALAESIPAPLKVRGRAQKLILKEAMAEWLPAESIARKKVGFETPIDRWLRVELRDHLEQRLLDADSACRRYLDADTVREVITDHERGRHDHKRILFALLTFELWHEQFIKPPAWRDAAALAA